MGRASAPRAPPTPLVMLNAIFEQTAMAACARRGAQPRVLPGSAARPCGPRSSSFSGSAFPAAVRCWSRCRVRHPSGPGPALSAAAGRAGQEEQGVPMAGASSSTAPPAGHVSLCPQSRMVLLQEQGAEEQPHSGDVLCIPLAMSAGRRREGAAEAPGVFYLTGGRPCASSTKISLPGMFCGARKAKCGFLSAVCSGSVFCLVYYWCKAALGIGSRQ